MTAENKPQTFSRRRENFHKQFLLGLLLWSISGITLGADIYRWEEDGKVHFGDRPPSGKEHREVTENIPGGGKPPLPSVVPSEEERRLTQRRLLEEYERQRSEKKSLAQEEKQRKMERERSCALASDRLRRLQEAQYLYTLDEKGNRRIYSVEERRAADAKAQQEVKKWCE